MARTGIDLPAAYATGIDKEHIIAQLDYQKSSDKLQSDFKNKILDKVFSHSVFVFLITGAVICSGFVYMSSNGTTKQDIIEYWKLILPVVSTYIGYAIGKGSNNEASE